MTSRPVSDLRAAVIGSGFIAALHIDAIRRLGAHVAGVLTRDPSAARRRGTACHLYGSLDELCADRSVDVVHVTSPNHLHAPQAHALIAAGKHVVCEKPLARTSGEGREMTAAATAAGLVHAVCFNIRYYPALHEARAHVRTGKFGRPRLITGQYLQDWLLKDTDWNWRLDPGTGGVLRAVADIGSHWLDLASFVTGLRITEVMADLHTFVPVRRRPAGPVQTFSAGSSGGEEEQVEMRSDDAAGILLRFEGGARGVLTVSQVSPGRKNAPGLEIACSESSIAWHGEQPEILWIGHRGQRNELLQRDPALMSAPARAVSRYPGGHAEGFADTFLGLISQIYADVAAGGPSAQPAYPTFADGLQGLLVEDAIIASSRHGRWATVDVTQHEPADPGR
jgi:predicted dehydrogenase